jgi:TPR repeat protein
MALPYRSTRLHQVYAQIAAEAGFPEVHFRDMAVSTEMVWHHTWGETFPYVTVCNLGASRVSFTLLKCRHGGSEYIDHLRSIVIVGVDEIDRIILNAADPGNIAPPDSHDALAQLKLIRRNCVFETPELFHFYLHGKKKRVRTIHFETATRIFLDKVLARFRTYIEKSSAITGIDDIPVLLVGGGANNPLIAQTIENAAPGKVYWWAEAENAGSLGTAMAFLPKTFPLTPTEDEQHFHQVYENAASGNTEAQCDLAYLLEIGKGTAVSLEEAFDWYWRAARNGSPRGKFGMARFLFQGLATPRDTDASVQYLRESAEAGYAPSQFSLAMFLFGNRPEAKDEADAWLRCAAEQRYVEALDYLKQHSTSPFSASPFTEPMPR